MHCKLNSLLVLIIACAHLVGCNRQSTPHSLTSPDAPILKIAVMADGHITVDGSPVTLESLRESLNQLADRKGAVWYYRETAQGEPPQQAMLVMKAVVENRLPIRLSTRPDYSDAVGMDGRPVK